MNEKLKQLIEEVGTDSSGKWMRMDQAEKLAKLIVDECLGAIDNTNQHHVHTSFDKGLVGATIYKSKQAVREHFGVDNA